MVNRELNYKNVYLIPNKTIVESRSDCDTSVTLGSRKFVMPVYPANMKSVVDEHTCEYLAKAGYFYTMHRFGIDNCMFTAYMQNKGLYASISIGLRDTNLDVVNLKPEYITLDIANAWSNAAESSIKSIKDKLPSCFLIVGNVATIEAVLDLQRWGADAVKVGIAGGHVCITKDKTGFHRPMVSTISECTQNNHVKVPIIADGGITCHGDIAKAIACGAHMVMAGMLFAGYDESAGGIVCDRAVSEKFYKEYYGSASEFNKPDKKNIEGRKVLVDYKGPMSKLLTELKEDLQSSISYAGGTRLNALKLARIIEV